MLIYTLISRQSRSYWSRRMNSKVRMIKKVIEDQVPLFGQPFLTDDWGLKEVMIHGTKARKSIKLYQFLMEGFLYTGGVISRTKPITGSKRLNRVLIGSRRPWLQPNARN